MIFLGLDIGTTNTKAVLLGSAGNLLGGLTISSTLEERQTAMIWYDHFCKVMDYFQSKGLLGGQKITCSITAQGGTFVLLDRKFKPVSRVYSWTESSDEKMVRDMKESFDSGWYYHTTGWLPSSGSAACKFKQLFNENKIPKNYRFFSTVPEFIYSQLSGKFVTDITNAQMIGICDFENCRWNRQLTEWSHLKDENLPTIISELKILTDEVASPWGKIDFATSSHDQYAAMQAADLVPDKSVMLGTGTAWVINSRSSKPLFDDDNFLTHPGRDIQNKNYGNIMLLGAVGAGFDTLLEKAGVTKTHLAEIETDFGNGDFPDRPVRIDAQHGNIDSEGDAKMVIRRYMEGVAAAAVFVLERFGISEHCDKIIMSGGAVGSRFWPQVIADLCGKTVEVVNFSEFTAYGAALYARSAVEGRAFASMFSQWNKSRKYEPLNASAYRQWYNEHQRAVME